MAEGFLKLHRKMLKWEWYSDIAACRLFLHCLLRANWQSGSWRGVEYSPGQFITSLSKLSVETGLSVKQVRDKLKVLEMTGELASKTTNKYRVITVKKWNEYQVEGNQNGKQRASKTATDKEDKNVKNKKIHNFSERVINYSELEELVNAKSD